MSKVNFLERDQLIQMMSSGKKIIIVDVLDSDHYAKEHIPGAISIPLLKLREKAPSLLPNKDDVIITYCANFDCPASTKAAEILMQMGYKNVFDYKGGIDDYKQSGMPLEGSVGTTVSLKKKVTLNGTPVTLVGRKIHLNNSAPDFKAVNKNMEAVSLGDFKDKIKVITSFVSIDTPVCDLQIKEFNKKAAEFSSDVVVIGISKDLPFAQERFCAANNIKNAIVLSDYKTSSFGINYGLLIKENNLLARSVIIIDSNNIIRYIEIVNELTTQPNYAEALKQLQEVISGQPLTKQESKPEKCVPCEGGTPPLAKDKVEDLLTRRIGWQLVDDKKIVKEFKFKDFVEAMYFLNLLAIIAEEQGHHPNFTLVYNKLTVTLTTHAANGLTDNDFIMAKFIDEII